MEELGARRGAFCLFKDPGLKDMKLRVLRLWYCRLHFSLLNMG